MRIFYCPTHDFSLCQDHPCEYCSRACACVVVHIVVVVWQKLQLGEAVRCLKLGLVVYAVLIDPQPLARISVLFDVAPLQTHSAGVNMTKNLPILIQL